MSRDASKDWTPMPLKSLFGLQTPGFWGGEAHGSHDVKVLRATNLTKDNKLNLNSPALRSFPERKREQKELQNNDIILERSGGSPSQPVGRVGFFEGGSGYSVSNFMQILRIDTQIGIPKFCYYLMAWLYEKGVTAKLQKATTGIRNLDYVAYLNTEVCIPNLREQRRIAEILSSVDDSIAATQAVIEQTLNIRNKILLDIIQGKNILDARKFVCDWRMGNWGVETIPASWNIVRVADVAQLESGHTPSKRIPEYWGGTINWLSLHDTKSLNKRFIFDSAQKTTQLGIDNSSARILPVGTVCFSRTASIGHCIILGKEMATSQDFANYVCGPKILNEFLMYYFRCIGEVWKQFSSGSTHKTIYMPIFKQLQIILPPLSVQYQLTQVANSLYEQTDSLECELVQLQKLKSALMSDLLTGRKRVTDTLPLAAE